MCTYKKVKEIKLNIWMKTVKGGCTKINICYVYSVQNLSFSVADIDKYIQVQHLVNVSGNTFKHNQTMSSIPCGFIIIQIKPPSVNLRRNAKIKSRPTFLKCTKPPNPPASVSSLTAGWLSNVVDNVCHLHNEQCEMLFQHPGQPLFSIPPLPAGILEYIF